MGRPQGPQGLHHLRGPRRGWQGRRHQGDHRAGEPARLPGRRAARADRARESQMHIQRYLPYLPAAAARSSSGIAAGTTGRASNASWASAASSRRKSFSKAVPRSRRPSWSPCRSCSSYWLEVSPEEQTRRLEARDQGPAEDLEAVADGPEILHAVGRLHPARDEMFERHRHEIRAVVRGELDDKKRAPQPHHTPVEPGPAQGGRCARSCGTPPKRKRQARQRSRSTR